MEVNRILQRGPHANRRLRVWIGMCVLSNRTPTQQTVQLLPQLTGILKWENLLFQSSARILTRVLMTLFCARESVQHAVAVQANAER